MRLPDSVSQLLLGEVPNLTPIETDPLRHLAALAQRAWVWIPLEQTHLDHAGWRPYRMRRVVALTTHKVAILPAGMQEAGAVTVTHQWIESNFPELQQRLTNSIGKKYPISDIAGRVEDHIQDWITDMLEADRLARYQGGEATVPKAAGWAIRRTRDFLRTEGRDCHMRALFGAQTQTDTRKGCPPGTPDTYQVVILRDENDQVSGQDYWGEDGRQVQDRNDDLQVLRRLAAHQHGMAVGVLACRMLTDPQYEDRDVVQEYQESGLTATKALHHIQLAQQAIQTWQHARH